VRPARCRWTRRAERWAAEFDPWAPRAGDYLVASLLLLLLALAYVGERSCALGLGRRSLQLEERLGGLQSEVEMLGAEATALADRGRVVEFARARLGMTFPGPEDVSYIYYVSPGGGTPGRGSRPRRG
jgi:cell division protein FtsL